MELDPKAAGGAERINVGISPPFSLITDPVNLAMVSAAKRNGEFVTHFTPERTWLCKPQMMCVGRPPVTNHAGLLRDKLHVLLISFSTRLGECQETFINLVGIAL